MSILIKGMTMPKNCLECPLEDSYGGYACHIIGKKANWGIDGRLSDCPLVEVKPHGRLIDADMLTTVTEMVNGEFKTYIEVFEIADAPTIIEAEGENG